jgi:penicillin-binding protein 2
VTPHVAADVEQPTSDPRNPRVLRRFGSQPPRSVNVDPAALGVVQRGLWLATHAADGTSVGVFGSFPIAIAGKTGTADKIVTLPGENSARNQAESWWCGYGPYDNPTIVVCAVIENGGHGGVAAAPAALKVFEQWFGKSAQTTAHASD